jgi:hypothetical protein
LLEGFGVSLVPADVAASVFCADSAAPGGSEVAESHVSSDVAANICQSGSSLERDPEA